MSSKSIVLKDGVEVHGSRRSRSSRRVWPLRQRRRRGRRWRSVSKISPLVTDEMGKNIAAIKAQIDSIFEVQSTLKVPLSLRKMLYDTFRCVICHAIMTPPVIFAKCCKRLLGCEACIDTWYGGTGGITKTCPQCRGERAYADTCRMGGMDDFLVAVKNLTSSEDAEGPGSR